MTAVRSGSFRPAWPGCPVMAGLVTTWRLAPDAGPGDPVPAMLGALGTLDRNRVLLIDAGGSATAQCFGGVLGAVARSREAVGALVHGAVRDTVELAELGFPAYSVGIYPARLRGRLALRDTHVTVPLQDGPVREGDFVVADADGAVFLPAGQLSAVVRTARRTAGQAAAARTELLGRLLATMPPPLQSSPMALS